MSERPRQLDEITAAWHQAKEAFEESERRYHALVEHSLGLICTHDLTGRLLSVNPAAAHSLGYEPSQGVGLNLVEFLAPETRHLFDDYLRRIRETGRDAGLMRITGRDGGARVWMYRNVLYEEPGKTTYVLGHALDITERVVAERTLRENENTLRQAHAELDRRVQERTLALEQANDRLRVEIAERRRAEELRERALIEQRDTLTFLATVSMALAPVVTLGELQEVKRTVAVPFAADWTIVYVQSADGAVKAHAGVHLDPGHAPLLADLAAAASTLAADSLVARAMATGQVMFDSESVADLAARVAGPGDAVPLLRALATGSVAVVPLTHAHHRTALVLGARSVNRFFDAGRSVIENLARQFRLAIDRIQLYREADEANRLKDEFLSTLSHELRTPLNAVFGWARILRLRELDPHTAHAVEVIERNAEAQLRLIEDVLDVSRIITGKMTLAKKPLSIQEALAATIDGLRPTAEAKGIRVDARLDQHVASVSGDPHRLQQVFWNVLSNALKFTRSGDTITITLQRAKEWAEIQIADTGVGIREDVLPFVFDRFRQADSSITRSHGGLGLGLAIVQHIVELHGGTVAAHSPGVGRGATFTIRLPLDATVRAPADTITIDGPSAVGSATNLRGRVVLLVEDHEDARELVESVLRAAGAEVISTGSTEEALERIASTTPDVLLADLGLPGEDGYTLLQRIRAMNTPQTRALPAVALTAYARLSDRERALAAGFLRYVIKPADPAELLKVLASVLETSASKT